MANFDNVNVTGDLRRVFETAVLISSELGDPKLRTAYFIISILDLDDSIMKKFFFEYGIRIVAPSLISSIILEPGVALKIFGEEMIVEVINSDDRIILKEEKRFKFPFMKNDVDIYDIPNINIEYSSNLQKCLEEAASKALYLNEKSLDVNNLLYVLLSNKETSAYKLVEILFNDYLDGAEVNNFMKYIEQNCYIDQVYKCEDTITIPDSLESCCENFNQKFLKGKRSDILGRDNEKKQLWNIFSKKTKSNAILVGSPGVGKTALIEAITQDIVNEECPQRFLGYTVISFDIEASVAGTKYRGEFEAKIAMLKKFIEQTPKIILFIDEIHRTLGVGSAEGNANDLSGALKSTLARDDVIVVGTTTTEEYKKFIASDGAFKRRFETVMIKEPKRADVKAMVKKKIETLEKFHGVKLEEDLLEYLITASSCFNFSSANPDRTLDLADRTMAIAENIGDVVVNKDHVKKVFEDSYEKLYSMNENVKRIIAYHETAHYVVSRVTKSYEEIEMVAVSIVPANDFLGVNIPESKGDIILKDRETYIDSICVRLAGRVIEKMRFNNVDSGASNDLEIATIIAKELVMCYGMDNEFGNVSFVYDGEQIMGNSEKYENLINEKIIGILKDATEKTQTILKDNMDFVDLVANTLIEKSLLTKEDLDLLYNEYMSTK